MSDELTPEALERIQIAVRASIQYRLNAFSAMLEEHRRHPTFGIQDWPRSRELGFVCRCTGEEREYRINVRELREMVAEAQDAFLRLRERIRRHGAKKRRKAERKATAKSRALLHRFLTKQQRKELRALQAFQIRGGDGLMYKIAPGQVCLLDGDVPIASFCIVQKDDGYLPVYDLMLARKLMLETNPAEFWSISNICEIYHHRRVWVDVVVPEDALNNPRPWVARRLVEAQATE